MKAISIIKYSIILCSLALFSCRNSSDNKSTNQSRAQNTDDEWTVPRNEVLSGGPGKDGIPSVDEPKFVSPAEADYLVDNDLVLGYKVGNDIRAYPHNILNWHEIINDDIAGKHVAVTYCPLTGTGIGWDRELAGDVTTFGVSGKLYNSNLIPYDRKTDSFWTQIGLEAINGELKGKEVNTFFLVETTWKTWKTMYPETKVVSSNTGHSRNYRGYPYGDYRTDHDDISFPVKPMDNRLPAKERVHGIVVNEEAKVYRFSSFPGKINLVQDEFNGVPVVVVGSQEDNFIVSYEGDKQEGNTLEFKVVEDALPVILEDSKGNRYDIFGEVVEGPGKGNKLTPTTSFIGYWFSWGAFYPGVEIYEFSG